MESALPLILFLVFLFGSCILILVCGIQGRSDESATEAQDLPALLDARAMPRFFGRPGERAPANPVAVVVDEEVVHRVEGFLREELALAEVFLEAPTAAALHDQPEVEEPSASLVQRLEQFLRNEQQAAADFVSHPSVARLHGSFSAVPVSV